MRCTVSGDVRGGHVTGLLIGRLPRTPADAELGAVLAGGGGGGGDGGCRCRCHGSHAGVVLVDWSTFK